MRVITIGRSSDNDNAVHDGMVSRHHCQIRRDDKSNFYLIDFGSTDGTQIKDFPVLK